MQKLVAYLIALTDAGMTFAEPKDWPQYKTVDEAAQAWLERPNAPIRVLREDGSIDFGVTEELQPIWDRLKKLRGQIPATYVFVPYNEDDLEHQKLVPHIGFPLEDVPELQFLAEQRGDTLKYTGNYTFQARDGWFVHDGHASATVPPRAASPDAAIPLILKLRAEGLGGERCASPEGPRVKRPLDVIAASMASNFLKANGTRDAAIDKLKTASKDTSVEGRALYRRAIQLLRTEPKPRRFPRRRK